MPPNQGLFAMPNSSTFAITVAAALVSLTLSLGCTRSERSLGDLDLAQAQLDTLWSGLSAAMMAGDTSRLSAFYSDSALFAETGSPTLVGLPRIKAAAAGVFACCRYRESGLRPQITELSGRRAFQFGTYRDVIQPIGQEPVTFHGRFSAVLDRGSANSWYVTRLVVIRDSSIPPLPPR
jgi:ketosteroid isomerase-like protein